MAAKAIKIAIIISSTRKPRVGPSITKWVTSIIASTRSPSTTLETVDLTDYLLPLSPSGPTIPARITTPGVPVPKGAYGDAQIDAWSEKIAEFDGFIFVTPQYNWSIPAVLKVAVDHLFHEWLGKPVVIISYGGRGGGKAAAALREIWSGVRGGEVASAVELPITLRMDLAQSKGELHEGQTAAWEKDGKAKGVMEAFARLVSVLEGKVDG
jgi:NAD(P)H-dependent FMN reductase